MGDQFSTPCPRWMKGNCPFTEFTCKFKHSKEHMPLCEAWKRGECIGGHGNNCKNRHYYKESDQTHQPDEQQEDSEPSGRVLSDFNSPLVVKIRKITEKRRREEVDLETGQRRSFTETFEQEIVDITGKENTPEVPKKKARRGVISPLIKSTLKDVEKVMQDGKSKNANDDSVILIDDDSFSADVSNVSQIPLPDENSNLETSKIPHPSNKQNMDDVSQMNESLVGSGFCVNCKKTFKGHKGLKSHLTSKKNVACKLANDAAAKSTESGTLEERSRDDNIEISFIVID